MDLYTELEPMMWAFLSGVDEDKIHANTLTPDERLRVERAIKILQDTPLYLEDEENYDISFLSHTIEHYKTEHNIGVAVIDYLELTSALTSEFTQITRGMGVREDQVLLNLSTNIKNLAKRFDIAIIGFTQTTDEARRDAVRDQRAVKGARSLPNKCDLGLTSFAPTKQEIELLEPLIEKCGLNNYRCRPNIGYSVYKNRGGKFKNIKIWGYQDLGTMEYVDLFCTDESYAPINVDKTYLMPNIASEIAEDEEQSMYVVNQDTGEIIEEDEDIDAVVDMSDFADFNNDEDEDEEDQFSEAYEEQLSYKEQIIEYNNSILHQYQEYQELGLYFDYDNEGVIIVKPEEYNNKMIEMYEGNESYALEADELGVLHVTSIEVEPQEEVVEDLKDPFDDLPIVDDSELEFLEEVEIAPTVGVQKRIGF